MPKLLGSIHIAYNGTVCVYPLAFYGIHRYYGDEPCNIPEHGGGTFECHCLLSGRYCDASLDRKQLKIHVRKS